MYTPHPSRFRRTAAIAAGLLLLKLANPLAAQNAYVERDLVSDLPGVAEQTDPYLLNPWGLAASSGSPWWISANHSGVSTLYNGQGIIQSLIVSVPTPGTNPPPSAPTGVLFNGSSDFQVASNTPARFIFVTEDGALSGWGGAGATNAVLEVDNSGTSAIYKGLAMAASTSGNRLYAADFHNGKVDVFDASYTPVTLAAGAFVDPNLPAGFAPFGIRNFGGQLFVTYALQDADAEDDVPGGGNGYIDVYDTEGNLVKRFASQGSLNSPWGLAMAPADFGAFSGSLLVGNFGNGKINAFDPATGNLLGQLQDANGNPISISGLWDIQFGNGANAGPSNTLYFTAGISAGEGPESHGLFGSLSVLHPISVGMPIASGPALTLSWSGGAGPFLLQKKSSLTGSNWFDVLTTSRQSAIVPTDDDAEFYRLVDRATNQVTGFTVLMDAADEVPANSSAAVAVGLISIQSSNLAYHIRFSGLSGNATMAHIHAPASSTNSAGVLIPLSVPATTSGVMEGTLTLTSSQLTNIFTGKAYVNIHTGLNPAGEIRGQIVPLHVRVDLDAASEVPAITGTDGQASGSLTFIGNDMFYNINFTRMSSAATMAHVHGPADSTHNAGVLFPLSGASGTSGTLSGSQVVTPDALAAILSGNTYVNIHTTINGGGEIRGQILPQQFVSVLDSAAEGPTVVSDGFGHGLLSLNGSELDYSIYFAGLDSDATAAHLHGPADTSESAGVLFPLSGVSGTSGTLAGTQNLTADQLAELVTGFTYVNIHTTNYPGGEIRGQVRPRE